MLSPVCSATDLLFSTYVFSFLLDWGLAELPGIMNPITCSSQPGALTTKLTRDAQTRYPALDVAIPRSLEISSSALSERGDLAFCDSFASRAPSRSPISVKLLDSGSELKMDRKTYRPSSFCRQASFDEMICPECGERFPPERSRQNR